MQLSRLLDNWLTQQDLVQDKCINNVLLDSQQVAQDDVFCALSKDEAQKAIHIKQALDQGAAVVLVAGGKDQQSVTSKSQQIIGIPNLPEQLPQLAINRYGKPSLALFAVTGTNGKTSVAWMASQLLTMLGQNCGYLGTLGCKYGDVQIKTGLTTPDIFTIFSLLAKMEKAGVKACVIEASSHAIAQKRIAGLQFSHGIFTNITQDHLDYHGDMESYQAAKWQLWDMCDEVIANADDPATNSIDANKLSYTFGYQQANFSKHIKHIQCTSYRASTNGLNWQIATGDVSTTYDFHSSIVGHFMLDNLLAVTALAHNLGYSLESVQRLLPELHAPPGRMQKVHNRPAVLVDYAHTPDAFNRLLAGLREICQQHQRIGVVFGCGGDRDKSKRPQMGHLASVLADRVFITSDNPRSESPQEIIDQIIAGVHVSQTHKIATIAERRDAIAHALNWCTEDDCLAIAGKGHEKVQISGNQQFPFDDVAEARKLLRRL